MIFVLLNRSPQMARRLFPISHFPVNKFLCFSSYFPKAVSGVSQFRIGYLVFSFTLIPEKRFEKCKLAKTS